MFQWRLAWTGWYHKHILRPVSNRNRQSEGDKDHKAGRVLVATLLVFKKNWLHQRTFQKPDSWLFLWIVPSPFHKNDWWMSFKSWFWSNGFSDSIEDSFSQPFTQGWKNKQPFQSDRSWNVYWKSGIYFSLKKCSREWPRFSSTKLNWSIISRGTMWGEISEFASSSIDGPHGIVLMILLPHIGVLDSEYNTTHDVQQSMYTKLGSMFNHPMALEIGRGNCCRVEASETASGLIVLYRTRPCGIDSSIIICVGSKSQ